MSIILACLLAVFVLFFLVIGYYYFRYLGYFTYIVSFIAVRDCAFLYFISIEESMSLPSKLMKWTLRMLSCAFMCYLYSINIGFWISTPLSETCTSPTHCWSKGCVKYVLISPSRPIQLVARKRLGTEFLRLHLLQWPAGSFLDEYFSLINIWFPQVCPGALEPSWTTLSETC